MKNETGMRKVPPTGNPRPRPCFHLSGDGNEDEDDFGSRDRDRKAFLGPTPLRPVAIPTYVLMFCLRLRSKDVFVVH